MKKPTRSSLRVHRLVTPGAPTGPLGEPPAPRHPDRPRQSTDVDIRIHRDLRHSLAQPHGGTVH